MKEIGFGIIGCGVISKWHAESVAAIKGCKLIGATDRVKESADAFAAKIGRRPAQLEELVSSGVIREIPPDPFGAGFVLDTSGVPVFGKKRRR